MPVQVEHHAGPTGTSSNADIDFRTKNTLLESATSAAKRRNMAERLPNEILAMIIGDEPGPVKHSSSQSGWTMDYRIACSLVCRKWRRIALPHLFRCIRISGNTVQKKNLKGHCSFLRENPWLANSVKDVYIEFCVVDVAELEDLLATARNIETLSLLHVSYIDSGDPERPHPVQVHHLQKLRLNNRVTERLDVAALYGHLLRMIGLFSEIQNLQLDSEELHAVATDDSIAFALQEAAPKELKIHTLGLTLNGALQGSFLRTFLPQIGAFKHLTSVGFVIGWNNPSLVPLLASVGRNLKRFSLALQKQIQLDRTTEIIPADGLRACSHLEELAVKINSYFTRTNKRLGVSEVEWEKSVRLISLIPEGHVRSVTLGSSLPTLASHQDVVTDEDPVILTNVHEWPWYGMRTALRQFTNCRTIMIKNDFKYSTFYQHRECVEYELREFGDILSADWFGSATSSNSNLPGCTMVECREYSKKRRGVD